MFIIFNYKLSDKVIKSAIRRSNLIITIKTAKRALEVGTIMVIRTNFNIN